MIPSTQTLKNRMTSEAVVCASLNQSYFETAEEFVQMNKVFTKTDLIGKIMLWIDMVISPLITIVTALYNQEAPSIFSVMSFYKTFSMWKDWLYFETLKTEIHEWTRAVKSVGGPFISTNDPVYHSYVYADGMERLRLLVLSKELAKSL